MSFHTMLAFIFPLCVLLSTAGCDHGPAVAPVTGTVTQDGQPLAQAMIQFQPDKGAPSYAETDENGEYEIRYQTDRLGALLGHHYVSVTTAGERDNPDTGTSYNVPEMVPSIYNEDTELEFEVKPGKNVFNIAIEGQRKKRGRNF